MPDSKRGISRRFYLIGFSGSGKSTVGPILAAKLGLRFLDTDTMIENKSGKRIAEIFAHRGERDFRKMESDLIKHLSASREGCVISLGGGAFTKPANRKLITESGTVIFLSCSATEIYRRLKDKADRPLLGGTRSDKLTQIKSLLDRRLKSYKLAEIAVSTSNRTPTEAAQAILKLIKERYGNS